MKKQKMMAQQQYLENRSLDCMYLRIAQSSSEKALEYRQKNPHINFENCRTSCPMFNEKGFCNQYVSIDDLNMEWGILFEI